MNQTPSGHYTWTLKTARLFEGTSSLRGIGASEGVGALAVNNLVVTNIMMGFGSNGFLPETSGVLDVKKNSSRLHQPLSRTYGFVVSGLKVEST